MALNHGLVKIRSSLLWLDAVPELERSSFVSTLNLEILVINLLIWGWSLSYSLGKSRFLILINVLINSQENSYSSNPTCQRHENILFHIFGKCNYEEEIEELVT